MLVRAAGLDLAHVPYKGTADAMSDVLSGRVQFFFDSALTAVQTAKSGKVRIVAVATRKRIPQLPEIPTLRELGVPVGIDGFQAIFGPGVWHRKQRTRFSVTSPLPLRCRRYAI